MSTGSGAALAHVREDLLVTDPPSLLGGRCLSCGRVHFPRRPICPDCQAPELEPAPLATDGTVYTFTIVRARPPGYAGVAPYAYGIVELPDGLRITTTLTADSLEELQIGDRVRFELLTLEPEDGAPLLSFAYRQVTP